MQTSTSSSSALSLQDPLELYIKRAQTIPLLTREEEFDLAVKLFESDDVDAARRLAESNLRLVVKIAYEYKQAHQNLLDLIQEGNIGLLHAISKFDPHKGNRLVTYAAWWIRAYMLKFILQNHRLVRIGKTQAQRKLFFGLRKERERLEAKGFVVDSAILAANLNVREQDVIDMENRLARSDASFDAPFSSEDEDAGNRHDVIPSRAPQPDHIVESVEFQHLLKDKLAAFADSLSGREEEILRKRWLTDTPLRLRELGEEFGVSRERARQIEKRLLEKVKAYLIDELGAAVDVNRVNAA